MGLKQAGYNDYVFINCPFDDDYMPILHAIAYTIYRCGFVPQCALNEDDATDYRLDKIIRCIQRCRYGIHDISRTETNTNGLPRFNMPYELGLFWGAKRFGTGIQKKKNALILERTKYLYQQYLSDLNGVDVKEHNNHPDIVIRKVRDWLAVASNRRNVPGNAVIQREYQEFRQKLPAIVDTL
ncbi:hypothetical protein [Deminuibacter soli]|uniref:Uncharacterized protein n=1 Tax=Deminuibacter soli TaxID=2291815 RepID=A0A3E1NCF3_9BACT|nr:hypothetical protein [Deminuibacter soli]RFM25633.1 hypothetical protein DXN05_24155 [Deminuibacter soli]